VKRYGCIFFLIFLIFFSCKSIGLKDSNTIYISWKGIHCNNEFFDLYIVLNDTEYYIGNFFGTNPNMNWTFRDENEPEYILNHFRSIWTGAGSDFYIMLKNETELAVMFYNIRYGEKNNFSLNDYKEIFVIPIKKGSNIQMLEQEEDSILKRCCIENNCLEIEECNLFKINPNESWRKGCWVPP
jgi:hypothetical protein